MGAFIEQVQKNNQIQKNILTEKQLQRIEKAQKEQEKERIKREKEETIFLKKEAIQHLDAYLEDVFIGIIKRKPIEKYNTDYATYLKNELLVNKDIIINDIFKGTLEKEIINNLWFTSVKKKYKEALEIEKVINENLEKQYNAAKPQKKQSVSQSLKQINFLLSILLLPFTILLAIISLLFGVGLQESKKNNKW